MFYNEGFIIINFGTKNNSAISLGNVCPNKIVEYLTRGAKYSGLF